MSKSKTYFDVIVQLNESRSQKNYFHIHWFKCHTHILVAKVLKFFSTVLILNYKRELQSHQKQHLRCLARIWIHVCVISGIIKKYKAQIHQSIVLLKMEAFHRFHLIFLQVFWRELEARPQRTPFHTSLYPNGPVRIWGALCVRQLYGY